MRVRYVGTSHGYILGVHMNERTLIMLSLHLDERSIMHFVHTTKPLKLMKEHLPFETPSGFHHFNLLCALHVRWRFSNQVPKFSFFGWHVSALILQFGDLENAISRFQLDRVESKNEEPWMQGKSLANLERNVQVCQEAGTHYFLLPRSTKQN